MLTFLFHIIGYDIWFYLSHRLLHTGALWWIHAEHHKYVEPRWPDTYKGHILESVLQGLGYGLPFMAGFWSSWETVAALLLINLRGVARHDARTAWLDGGHHLTHHRVFNKNYGEPWLDWLGSTYINGCMGSERVPALDRC